MTWKSSLNKRSSGVVSHVVWQPLLFALVLLTVTFALWHGLRTQENWAIDEAISNELAGGVEAIVNQTNANIATSRYVAERLKEWDYNAQNFSDKSPGLVAMGWVDASYNTRYMVPSSAKDLIGDLGPLLTENQPKVAEEAKEANTSLFSGIVVLKPGGKFIFLVTPLASEDQFSGFLVDVFNANLAFGSALKASIDAGWVYRLWDGKTEIQLSAVSSTPGVEKWSKTTALQIPGMNAQLKVIPGPAVLAKLVNRLSTVALIAGLALTVVFTWGSWSAQTVKIKSDELREATGLLRQFREAMDSSAIVSMADVGGAITYANDNFCKISRYSREELLGKNHRIIKSGLHPQEYYSEMRQTIAAGKVWQGEICDKAKDGSHYWVFATIFPFMDVDGKTESYMGISNDITDRKRLEEDLQRSNRALEEFNHIVAHELKTPVAVVKMAADNLVNSGLGPLSKIQVDIIGMVDKTMDQMASTITGLLHMAQLGTKEKKLVLLDMDVKLHVGDVLQSLKAIANEKNIVIRDAVPKELPQVKSSSGVFVEILTNLIGNAIRYASHEVWVEAQLVPGGIQFAVCDDGPGIPKEKIGELFGKFVSDNKAQSAQFKGTGLGLYICKDLVTHLGGKIWVESDEGKGTCFYFTLPMGDSNSPVTAA